MERFWDLGYLSCCGGWRGLWGARGEGTPSRPGRHHARTAQGTCQPHHTEEPRTGRAGLFLTTAHTSSFPSPSKKKKADFLQGDDFEVLWATLPVARGFSRYLGWETSKACVFPPKSTLSNSWVRLQFKLLQWGTCRLIWLLYYAVRITALKVRVLKRICLSICMQWSGNVHHHMYTWVNWENVWLLDKSSGAFISCDRWFTISCMLKIIGALFLHCFPVKKAASSDSWEGKKRRKRKGEAEEQRKEDECYLPLKS